RDLFEHGSDGIIGDKLLRIRIITIARSSLRIIVFGSPRFGQGFVVPDAVFPAAGANAVVRSPNGEGGGLEGATVDGHADGDLGGRDAAGDVVCDCAVGAEGCAVGVR